MFTFSVILFLTALLFLILGISVYKGNIGLIHSYHQENVTDKIGYGKAMGKALLIFSASMLIPGVIALFTESALPVVILSVGMIVGFVAIIKAQQKYNGGLF